MKPMDSRGKETGKRATKESMTECDTMPPSCNPCTPPVHERDAGTKTCLVPCSAIFEDAITMDGIAKKNGVKHEKSHAQKRRAILHNSKRATVSHTPPPERWDHAQRYIPAQQQSPQHGNRRASVDGTLTVAPRLYIGTLRLFRQMPQDSSFVNARHVTRVSRSFTF